MVVDSTVWVVVVMMICCCRITNDADWGAGLFVYAVVVVVAASVGELSCIH